ncbi:beta-glucosidase [Microcoleus sp. FACHB-1515]|uniref:GH1 family beta-glucosidase n=1 Tax=Cyanophyceae TaxID=3028117 RepID=UPI001682622C|nr:GH1 family beta-glucosidase [Microcoleus sp. FACHB-1515]MBD2091459.1 beta-glucosidase [Microcoleus sp. FACHB-1515]
MSDRFPDNFWWGAATAAYQIEGAALEDGRKPSTWDAFSQKPGKVLNGDTGAIACDHYHRYADDVKLMADLGIRHYRFSIAWPRILPEGRGAVNQKGLDFYKRLVDTLREHNITPHATLFHWDTPQALEQAYGGWQNRQIASDFADYATVVVRELGDRVSHWMTLNEIACFTHLSYAVGWHPPHAPGKQVKRQKDVWQTSHHALLAHGMAVQAIRTAAPGNCSIALVDNPVVTIPLTESPADIAAAQAAFPVASFASAANGGLLYPALTGKYHPALLDRLGRDAPDMQPGDLDIIHQPIDALGLNLYTGTYVRAIDRDPGFELLDVPPGYPRLHMPWLQVVPECIYWAVRHVSETVGRSDLPMWITENGCAADDQLKNGEVIDTDRIFYLRQHFRQALRATQEGYPLQGYFVWSLMDNFEWAWGFDRRFGLIYIDYPTQQRIPKSSYHWYRECIRQNRVV